VARPRATRALRAQPKQRHPLTLCRTSHLSGRNRAGAADSAARDPTDHGLSPDLSTDLSPDLSVGLSWGTSRGPIKSGLATGRADSRISISGCAKSGPSPVATAPVAPAEKLPANRRLARQMAKPIVANGDHGRVPNEAEFGTPHEPARSVTRQSRSTATNSARCRACHDQPPGAEPVTTSHPEPRSCDARRQPIACPAPPRTDGELCRIQSDRWTRFAIVHALATPLAPKRLAETE
jgi:hypothetical protein